MDLEKLHSLGEKALQDAVDNSVQESLTLDFKLGTEGQAPLFSDGKLTRDGRKVVAKALSAFSNSAGGLLILGVNCRSIDGIDCASGLSPIENYQAALSSLNSAVGDLLQPKNSGIAVHGFPSAADPAKGYIVVDVPRSDRRPHRAEGPGQKGYFKRSGASSFEMEHYDIEDAFRRKVAPELELELRFVEGPDFVQNQLIYFEFWVANVGEVSAEHAMLELIDPSGLEYGWQPKYRKQPTGIHLESDRKRIKFYADSNFVIHPHDARLFAIGQIIVKIDDRKNVISVEGRSDTKLDFGIQFELKAKDMRVVRAAIDLDGVYLDDKPWRGREVYRQNLSESQD